MKIASKIMAVSAAVLMSVSMVGCDAVSGVAGDVLKDQLNGDSKTDGTTDADADDKSVDLKSFAPSGETFFQNTSKEAGSKLGSGSMHVLVTTKDKMGMLYVVNADTKSVNKVNGPNGKQLQVGTEVLGGAAFAPLYIKNIGSTSIKFDHRVKAGECNTYSASKDGDVFNAEITDEGVACDY